MEKNVPTIKQIAQQLHISISTVSRALHDHKSIGLRTKAMVKELAEQLGYQPNLSAISLKQGKNFTIGMIVPNLSENFFSLAISGVEDLAMYYNYNVLIGQSHDESEREIKIIDAMTKQGVDGLIISMAKHTKNYDHFQQVKRRQIPMVFFDRVPSSDDFHKVYSNMYEGTRQAIEYLFDKGHKRIALLNGPVEMKSCSERFEMYKKAMMKRRLKIDMQLVVSTNLTRQGTEAAMEELLNLKQKPTAILSINDYVALDAIRYTRTKNLKINEDILFVSYANLPITNYMENPPIASVEQYPYKQATRASEILFELIDKKHTGETIPWYNEVVDCRLIEH